MKIKKFQNKPGFTLMEMVVVLFVAGLGLMAILSLSVNSLRVQSLSKNSATATLLAEEGLELFKSSVNAQYLADVPNAAKVDWLKQFDINTGNDFRVDYVVGPEIWDGADLAFFNLYRSDGQYYSHDINSPPTIFKRVLRVTDNSEYVPDSVKVQCEVSWEEKGQSYNYSLVLFMYDWKQI